MEENEEKEKSLKKKLDEIKDEIKISWIRDCDRTEYMLILIKMLKEMQTKDSLEEYFSNNEEDLTYFMGDFLKDVISNILTQPIIFGDNGDEIGLDLLLNIYKLFQKFHKNKKYAPLYENIRQIFAKEKAHDFFSCTDHRNRNPVKKYNCIEFNKEYNSNFLKKDKINKKFTKGDEVDIPINNKDSKSFLDKKSWVRGRIKEIKNDEYIIEYGKEDETINVLINDYNIYPAGKKTNDWDWRISLKQYDVIDCFDRSKWYPSTIMRVIEDEVNGFKKVKYKVGFRLYPQHFKNPEDENDKCENHLDIWKQAFFSNSPIEDSDKKKYFGDQESYDEIIPHYSKRIQKFNTYSRCQQKFINYSSSNNYYSSNEKSNPMKLMNENLQNDTEISMEELYDYESNGKKNYIIGKNKDFISYYALFLKKIENEGSFTQFIEILKNEPNSEEIYNIFFILSNAFSYLHSGYFKENSKIIKDSLIKFINNLDSKEMKNLPKDLIDIISDLLKKISNYNNNENNDNKDNEALDLYEEINLTLSTKIIKSSIFDRRLQGIKSLNEYIEKNNNNSKVCKKIIKIIKDNKIIEEIFGANYHSQIINKSTEIVKLLLSNNELSEDDMKLIWSCTKRGDLEAKVTILKLLSQLVGNLDAKSVEMLLNNIITNVDKKINIDELELVYNLSKKGDNKNNLLILCDYFCQCLLSLNNTNISNNDIFIKLSSIISKDEEYLKKVLNICENCLKTNERAIMSYSILYQVMDKSNDNSVTTIFDFIKNEHLLNLYKDNFRLYIKQAKEMLTKNSISLTEGDIIDKYIIDGFSHLGNITKRMEFFPHLINVLYKDFNFLPFLKDVLITNAVSPNDQLIFYDFVEKYLKSNENNVIDDEANKRKEEIKNELFILLSDDNQKEVTMEQLKLFIKLFFDINKIKKERIDDGYKIINSYNIEEIKGLDNLWNIILRAKDQKILSISINILFQIYKNKYVEELMKKCNNLINGEKSNPEVIEKCLMLLKLVIIESEKDIFFKPKSHLSLLKNCLISLPLNIRNRKPDLDKSILLGNTTINDLKIILSKLYEMLPKSAKISLSEEYLNKVKEIKNLKNKQLFEKEIDGSNNNNSLYELLLINNNIISDLKPEEKINASIQRDKVSLIENGEMNSKFIEILKDWFNQFAKGTGKMDLEATKFYISKVTNLGEDETKARVFLKDYAKENEGFLNEEEFIDFYKSSLMEGKTDTVWKNIYKMGIREDLKKKEEPYFEYTDREKLPRYKLGNDLNFIQNLIKQFYNNPNKSYSLLEFLLFLNTNEYIYNEVLNMYNEENKDSLINKALNDEKKYVEQNYIFIIIESILQDLEINMYKNNAVFENTEYKLIQNKYEPFDDEDKDEKKLNFLKNLIKKENFEKIFKYINNLLMKIKNMHNTNEEKSKENDDISSYLYTCCLKGLKIINIINNLYEDTDKQIIINELNENHIFKLGQNSLSLLLKDIDFKKELDNISYLDLISNLISHLNNSNFDDDEKEKNKKSLLNKICLDLLFDLFSSKKQALLLSNISTNENIKKEINELFKINFSKNDAKLQKYFMEKIKQSIEKSIKMKNNDYILFLFQILNSLLDNILNLDYDQTLQDKKEEPFFPDQTFFELYSYLYKLISEIKNQDENKENSENKISITDLDNANSFLTKLYSILIKGLSLTPGEEDKKFDDKILLSILKLFIILIKDDEKLRNEILFKNTEGEKLFDLLFRKCISQFDDSKNGDENKDNVTSKNGEGNKEENKEDKFICLETLKKEEKVDNSSKEELNEICNELVLTCFKELKNPEIISKLLEMINLIKKSVKKEKKNGKDDSDSDEDDGQSFSSSYFHNSYSSKQHGHVGLKNLGCICYMNSIMQQIYMVPTFRYAIMHADDGETPKPTQTYRFTIDDDNLLHQLQIMYTYLTFSEKMDYNPRNFCHSFKDFDGKPINIASQQDSQEFYNNFCDKIENSLKKTKYKYIVNDVFTGRTCSSVLCQGCKHVSNRFEDFYNLTLEVKNINNLNDSLQKLIVPEIIDDFKCSNCNQSVQIKKVTSLNKLPNVLVVHLKRFYLDYETCHTRKINSKFEFPKKLNLKLFCVEEVIKKFGTTQEENTDIYSREDEYYQYELKGINVHTGSADGGHYFSFIDADREGKDNNMSQNPENKENWLIFNDSHVSLFDTDKIPSECYGGSSYEGYSYENCQNAYLLIYERKKKTPIKIILDEKEVKAVDKDKMITFEKEKRNEISKEYDISRIGNNIDEQNLYSLVFFDKEKKEYYKYIPYYNIQKYAPRKAYLECLKDNNKTPSNKSENKKNSALLKKYKEILVDKISNNNLNIKDQNYNDETKENVISIILDNFMKKLKQKQQLRQSQKEEINKELCEILQKIIRPLIEEETNLSILKIINSAFSKEDNLDKIFTNGSSFPRVDIITMENAEKVSEILFDLITIFIKKKDESKYFKELKKIIEAIYELINSSKTDSRRFSNSNDNDNSFTIICIYRLLHKLFITKEINEIILSSLIQNNIISKLISKLDEEKEEIRKVIYDSLIYLVKQTEEYKKEFFELKEGEAEGTYEFHDKVLLQNTLDRNAKLLFKEKKDLLFMLLTILEHNCSNATKEFINFSFKIFELYESKGKLNKYLEDFLNLILTQIKINDQLCFQRLYILLGYPTLVIKEIPRKVKKRKQHNVYNNYYDNNNDYNDNESEEKQKSEKTEQKWPIFGEKLINGDINKQIYRYKSNNNRKKNICLLNLLFPSEDTEKENNNKEKEQNKFDMIDKDDDENDFQEDKKNKNLVISDEIKRKILLDIINNCFGELSNYALFKYIYLMPARSLLYKNLFEEIMAYLKDDTSLNFEKIKEKEEKYIKNIERERNKVIEKAKKLDKEIEESEYGYWKHNTYDEDISENENCPPPDLKSFNCSSKKLKNFIGFNSDIIAGEIIREEICEIATSKAVGMYRIEYFTKYYNVDELRNKLLKNKDFNKNENGNIKEKISENNNKEEEKENKEVLEKKEEGNENKEENKEEENKEEQKNKEKGLENKEEGKENKEDEKENKEKENKEDGLENKEVGLNKEEEKDNKEEENKDEKENKEEENLEDNGNKIGKENEDEKGKNKDKEKIETEIEENLENTRTNKKYDVSEVNESKLIYNIFDNQIESYVLEDNSIKDKNKV